MEQTKLIAIYGRVSTSNQENEGTIETQLSAVNDFAHNNGYVIVQKYIDEGWSGDSLARPALDQLRMDAKKKNWEAVLVYDPDRLARRGAWQEVVIEELQELEIQMLFVTVPPPKTDEDKIMYKMRGVFTEYERMKIKERFRLGKVRKAREGHMVVTEAPYGYTFITKNGKPGEADFHQGYYQINDQELPVLKNIFSWADRGFTIRAIVKKLQYFGVPPRKSKRGVWNTSTLSTLLRNRTYIGEGHYGASYAVVPVNPLKKDGYRKIKKTSRRSKPEDEWIKIPTPKIIDQDLFDRVQQRLKTNFERSVRNTKNPYLLAGKIYCTCGVRRAGEGSLHGKNLYYRCTNRVKSFPLPPTCLEKGINARLTDSLVWEEIAAMMSSPKLLLGQAERWVNHSQNRNQNSTVDIEITKKEIGKLKEQETRFAKAYGSGVISIEQLKEYTDPLRERVIVFENQLSRALQEKQQANQYVLPDKVEVERLAQKATEKLGDLSFDVKKAIVGNLIAKVVGNKEELVVSGFIPLAYLEQNVLFSTNHRNGVNTIRPFDSTNKEKVIPFEFKITIKPNLTINENYSVDLPSIKMAA